MQSRFFILAAVLIVLLGGLLVARTFVGGSESGDLDVQTYQLEFLKPEAANRIIDPYVFPDRGGMISMDEQTRAITVREMPEMLSRIEEVLAKFDQPEPSVKLHFRLVEANGEVSAEDPRLEDVFRFKNYRLIGETVMTGIEWSNVAQGVVADGERYMIDGNIGEVRVTDDSGTVKLQVTLIADRYGAVFSTGVNARIGQLLVLGSAQPDPDRGALILAVRAELERP
jgi:type II secretory pathway component GspD/PulD (secretin)